jgi:hypothetical protein
MINANTQGIGSALFEGTNLAFDLNDQGKLRERLTRISESLAEVRTENLPNTSLYHVTAMLTYSVSRPMLKTDTFQMQIRRFTVSNGPLGNPTHHEI